MKIGQKTLIEGHVTTEKPALTIEAHQIPSPSQIKKLTSKKLISPPKSSDIDLLYQFQNVKRVSKSSLKVLLEH